MKIFFAGSQGFEKIYPGLKPYMRHRLLSYHYMTKSLEKYFLTEPDPSLVLEDLIMDSGAFSAWSKGEVVDLDKYIEFCLKHIDRITYVVNLDVIPAKPGQKSISQEEIERSASLGWRNAQKMLRAGIPKHKLIHVFHQNENFRWLERMVDEFEYIGLSPANDRTTAEKMVWLDQCMPYVTDETGKPIIKFHGFAVTAWSLMMRYPWFSVDSASWCQQSGRGVIYIPSKTESGYDYSKRQYELRIGGNSPFEKEKGGHFDTYPPLLQKQFVDYLESRGFALGKTSCRKLVGDEKKGNKAKLRRCQERCDCDHQFEQQICIEVVEEPGVINKYGDRAVVNAQFIVDFEAQLPPWPTKIFDRSLLKKNGFNF